MIIPTLETGRLILRAPCMADMDAYAAFLASDRSEGVGGPYPTSAAFPKLAAIIGHWTLRGFGRWTVADKQSGAPLGIVGPMHPLEWPEPEIAWSVFAGAEGRGIAFEAASAARSYVYDVLGWTTVISCTLPHNVRSIALAKRLGATRDGSFVHPEYGALFVWRHPPAGARS